MNHMDMQPAPELRELAARIGDFIRYWGFRKIHGQIWAVTFLSKGRLSGAELTELLGVSKALVSPALKELVEHGLIVETESENAKVKRYEAVANVDQAVHRVLQNRERPMLNAVASAFANAEKRASLREFVDADRMAAVGEMIDMAQMGIAFLLGAKLVQHD